MLWFLVAGFTTVFLAHTAPFPFLLERFAPSKSIWHVPRGTGPPTIYRPTMTARIPAQRLRYWTCCGTAALTRPSS